jgi:endoglucanase
VKHTRRIAAALATAAVTMSGIALATSTAQADGSRLPLPAAKALAGSPNPANPSNPLAGGSWAVNNGFWENGHGLYTDYRAASGSAKTYLGREALQPSALWMTINNSFVPTKVSDYLRTVNPTRDPKKLVQIAVFGLWPRGEGARHTPLTDAEQAHYKSWIGRVSAGIGSSRVLVALEPDLAITENPSVRDGVRDPQVRQGLTQYAARYFHDHNKFTSVYLDAGASDWLSPSQAAAMLDRSGIRYVRGFSLDITHYTKTPDNISHGSVIVRELARRGISGKHFVIDTADNGRGYTYGQWAQQFGTAGYDNSRNCASTPATLCNALGVPPTWHVESAAYAQALHLTSGQFVQARQNVDAYVWLTRPWMYNQASPYQQSKAIPAARYTPFPALF